MCIYCYEEHGAPQVINEKVNHAVKLIKAIRSQRHDNLHILLEDWNVKDDDIIWLKGYCLEKHGSKRESNLLDLFLTLSLPERYTALALYSGYIQEDRND